MYGHDNVLDIEQVRKNCMQMYHLSAELFTTKFDKV